MRSKGAGAVAESVGKCTKCGRRGLLGNGLCTRCWDGKEAIERVKGKSQYMERAEDKPRYSVTRRWKHKRGENRVCLSCSTDFYIRPSFASRGKKRFGLCPKCSKLFLSRLPPAPVWIGGKRYGIYDLCPVCLVTVLFCKHYPVRRIAEC